MTTLHMLAIQNDYELMSKFLQSKTKWMYPIEVGMKDLLGRNACDLAIELGHQQMLNLLQRYDGFPSVVKEIKLNSKASYINVQGIKTDNGNYQFQGMNKISSV